MATKPVTTVPTWASNANYSAGVDIGTPTKVDSSGVSADGHIAGDVNPTAAQHQNDWQNKVSNLCSWVESGSSLGATDAHIVETDASGFTSVAALEVKGNSSISSSLKVTRLGSSSQSILVEAGAGNGTITIGGNGIEQMSVVSATGIGAYVATTSGNAVPYRAVPLTTEPTVSASHNGGFGFKYDNSLGSPEPTRMYAVTGGSKRYIPLYASEFSRIEAFNDGPFDFNGDISARTTVIGPVDFDQWQAPQTGGNEYLYNITFEYSSASATADMWVALYNNGTLVRRHFMSLHGEVTIQQGNVRGRITGALALLGNSFTVEMYKAVGGGTTVHVENVILTVEPPQ